LWVRCIVHATTDPSGNRVWQVEVSIHLRFSKTKHSIMQERPSSRSLQSAQTRRWNHQFKRRGYEWRFGCRNLESDDFQSSEIYFNSSIQKIRLLSLIEILF
jgi:hypothetical protein